MPTYVYEFEDGKTIEVVQSMKDPHHEYLLHPDILKLMKVKRLINGCGLVFKGAGWTPKGTKTPIGLDDRLPSDMKVDDKVVTDNGFKYKRKSPHKTDEVSKEKIENARKFSNWLESGGAETLNKESGEISDIKKVKE